MINFLRFVGNIKLGDYLHQDGTINDTPSPDIIGVCVIPSGILPDRLARFISLTQMTSYYQNGRDINLKSKFKTGLPGKRKRKPLHWGYLNEKEEGNLLLINPYLPDSSFNPEFLKDLPGGNALQDYKGYENMKLYKEKYGNDKTLSNAFTEIIKESPTYRKDEWYLPAIGELTLIIPRFKFIRYKINEALTAGSEGIYLSGNNIWSSSEWDSRNAWYVTMIYGFVIFIGKESRNYVRAFLAL